MTCRPARNRSRPHAPVSHRGGTRGRCSATGRRPTTGSATRQDGRIRDASGHRHDGRFRGWGFRSEGLLDRHDPALALRGGTVTIPAGRALRLRRPFAIEFWIRRDGPIRSTPTLMWKKGSWLIWAADTGGNRLVFQERYRGTSRAKKAIHGQLGNARHVVFQCVRDGRCAWYVNGRLQEAQPRSHQPDASTEPIRIGGSLGFPFTIDELAFYRHALPVRRIRAHFAAARPGPRTEADLGAAGAARSDHDQRAAAVERRPDAAAGPRLRDPDARAAARVQRQRRRALDQRRPQRRRRRRGDQDRRPGRPGRPPGGDRAELPHPARRGALDPRRRCQRRHRPEHGVPRHDRADPERPHRSPARTR